MNYEKMADMYGESEEMNSILRNLLQSTPEDNVTPALAEGKGTASATAAAGSFNFSDHGGFFVAEGKESVGLASAFSSGEFDACSSSMKRGEFSLENNQVENFDFNCESGAEASDVATNQAQTRSSKRSRSAEVHNLSEKRRRSRINEKLKALQNLIPNSNKTDKASMLDEAIEYLKQLQLHVQMLTMRNGLSLYPGYLPGSLQPMQAPPTDIDFEEGRGANTYPGNQEVLMHTALDISNLNPLNQPVVFPSMTSNTISESSFPMQSSIHNCYGLLNHLASSKDVCRDDTLSRLQLDITRSGNNSSPGVSS